MSTVPAVVAAIDFGTAYSGYAFSFRHELLEKPPKINTCNWLAGSQSLISLKTPSVVLLKPDRTFHSFGYEAENKYGQLTEDKQHKGWLYFKHFKMVLHKNKVTLYTVISQRITRGHVINPVEIDVDRGIV